jgi:hypothetical protein
MQAVALTETKFTYEEDVRPELFFIPYLWALAVAYTSDCCWQPGAIKLYAPASAPVYVMGSGVAAARGPPLPPPAPLVGATAATAPPITANV